MKTILVTGSCGFIGFHLSKALLEKGFTVIGLDNLNDYYDINLKKDRLEILQKDKNFHFYFDDLINLRRINNFKSNINFAINLAAQAGVRLPENQNYKYEHSNVNGFCSFLEFCKQNNVQNILYASSSSVYSGIKEIPYREDFKLLGPSSKYAETKIMNEDEANNFAIKYKKNVIGLRFFTVYGPWGRPDMAYYKFTKSILDNKEIILFNNGKLSRDMTYIDDIVSGILSAIDYIEKSTENHEIFNLGNSISVNTDTLLRIIQDKFKVNGLIKYINNPKEVTMTLADCSKSKALLNYEPKVKIESGMEAFFDWFGSYYRI